MKLTRYTFLKGALGATVLPAFARSVGKPNLRFGFISDIHIRARASAERVYKPALEWFRAQGVDAVVCTGDLATTGLLSELKNVSDVWYEVFPGDRLPDGRNVEKVFLYGNHDKSPASERVAVRQGLGDEFKRSSLFFLLLMLRDLFFLPNLTQNRCLFRNSSFSGFQERFFCNKDLLRFFYTAQELLFALF